MIVIHGPPAECNTPGRCGSNTHLHSAYTREAVVVAHGFCGWRVHLVNMMKIHGNEMFLVFRVIFYVVLYCI